MKNKTNEDQKTTNNIGQSTKTFGHSGFATIFASKTLVKLLDIFVLNPDHDYYQRQLSKMTDSKLYSVQRELSRLVKAGLVTMIHQGNRTYYRANRNHPAFDDLKKALIKTVALGDFLRKSFDLLLDKVQLAFIYGSLASGEEADVSDIDLIIIGALTTREAAEVLGPLSRKLNREFNPTIYSIKEFKEKIQNQHLFVNVVLIGPKIWLIGDDDEFEKLLE